jgi:hypothetical protein
VAYYMVGALLTMKPETYSEKVIVRCASGAEAPIVVTEAEIVVLGVDGGMCNGRLAHRGRDDGSDGGPSGGGGI